MVISKAQRQEIVDYTGSMSDGMARDRGAGITIDYYGPRGGPFPSHDVYATEVEAIAAAVAALSAEDTTWYRARVGYSTVVWSYEGINIESAEDCWRLDDSEMESVNTPSDIAVIRCEFIGPGCTTLTIRYRTTPKIAKDVVRHRITDDYNPIGDLWDVLSAETDYPGWIIAARDVRKIVVDKRVMTHGSSLAVAITSEAKSMGLGRGDKVRITIEKI